MKNPAHVPLAVFANGLVDALAFIQSNPAAEKAPMEDEVHARRAHLEDILDKQWLALENCRMLAQRFPKEAWAQNIMRYCAAVGSVPTIIGR